MRGKAGNPVLRAGSKGEKVQTNSSHGGLLAAGAFLHFISCCGGHRAREMPSWPPHSHSISQKAHVGPRTAGTEQEKSKPQDYLFALTLNWEGDTSWCNLACFKNTEHLTVSTSSLGNVSLFLEEQEIALRTHLVGNFTSPSSLA